MTETCNCCGKPTDNPETHHVDHRHTNNHPNNKSTRDRSCHMDHHRNRDAAKFPYSPSP